jgi:hypothetical protein
MIVQYLCESALHRSSRRWWSVTRWATTLTAAPAGTASQTGRNAISLPRFSIRVCEFVKSRLRLRDNVAGTLMTAPRPVARLHHIDDGRPLETRQSRSLDGHFSRERWSHSDAAYSILHL